MLVISEDNNSAEIRGSRVWRAVFLIVAAIMLFGATTGGIKSDVGTVFVVATALFIIVDVIRKPLLCVRCNSNGIWIGSVNRGIPWSDIDSLSVIEVNGAPALSISLSDGLKIREVLRYGNFKLSEAASFCEFCTRWLVVE